MEIGKWYKQPAFGDALFCVTDIDNGDNDIEAYGFDYKGNWKYKKWEFGNADSKSAIEATKEEVESALIKEAERRYKAGDVVISLGVTECIVQLSEVFEHALMVISDFELWENGAKLYKEGQWAEIVECSSVEDCLKKTDNFYA